jgi:hypothetical protein
VHGQAAPSEQASTASSKDNQVSIDQSVALLRQDLRSDKKQTIAATLQLTGTEATKFWPVYDQYSAELSKLGDQKYALIKEYANRFWGIDRRSSATEHAQHTTKPLARRTLTRARMSGIGKD